MGGRKRAVEVHRLVASYFVRPFTGEQVNHIDGDKTNNLHSNLEWCTASQNVRHALRTKPRKTPRRRVYLTPSQVINIRHIGGYFPTTKLAELYRVDRRTIGRALKYKTHRNVQLG
ncbi:HNH endonuclease signature motif containing protein [Mycolicibacterium neoaurum]|uniref:HNH endonuclease signature motif containing protein n=1 Tax=Mycolicibacterium neoaurum TaxID=1795 RepID=UPI003557EA0F